MVLVPARKENVILSVWTTGKEGCPWQGRPYQDICQLHSTWDSWLPLGHLMGLHEVPLTLAASSVSLLGTRSLIRIARFPLYLKSTVLLHINVQGV